jgi:hypothetical protein
MLTYQCQHLNFGAWFTKRKKKPTGLTEKDKNHEMNGFWRKQNRDYAAGLTNAVNFLVA